MPTRSLQSSTQQAALSGERPWTRALSSRRLDLELVERELVSSRTEAKKAITAGQVTVAGSIQRKPSLVVSVDDAIVITGSPEPFVSRAGRKLDAALDAFEIDVARVRAIDVGASTGGFTDCLLQRGAQSVVATDVGHGQIDRTIADDERVMVVERSNIRTADVKGYGGPFDLVVADLSFISLRLVVQPLGDLGTPDAIWVVLIKPQFEVGRDGVGKAGVVRDASRRLTAVTDVVEAFASVGLGLGGLIPSPIRGTTGNVEYVACFTRGSGSLNPEILNALSEEETP